MNFTDFKYSRSAIRSTKTMNLLNKLHISLSKINLIKEPVLMHSENERVSYFLQKIYKELDEEYSVI